MSGSGRWSDDANPVRVCCCDYCLNRRPIYEYRCDERLKPKTEGSTRLAYTGLCGGLEDLKIETRLIDERFASVMGEYVLSNENL